MGACASAPQPQDEALALSPQRLAPGQRLHDGRLRVVRELGAGSWSNVYLVERARDGRRYALKRTLITELSDAEKWIAVNECRLLASLSHPNVVEYKHCFVEQGCLNVVMEAVPNGELAAVIRHHHRAGSRPEEEDVWGYLLQVALGLQHLHASGIIHRDIKPANILVGREGVLKIADLGVAGLLHMGSSKLQIGTPQYMAPEQHAGRQYSYPADVWSLGCLLCELCTLEPLFGDRDEEVVAKKVLALALPPAIPAKYSPELQIMINRMLQQDPAARPTVDQVLASPQLQSRMRGLPAELSSELSLRAISLDCMEGLPMLPPIEVPQDITELSQRLPPGRGSFDHADEASDMAQRLGLPAIPAPKPAPAAAAARSTAAARLPRVGSPVTVLAADPHSPACSADTPRGGGCAAAGAGAGGTASSTLSAIDAAVAAALAAEMAASL